MHAKEGYQQEKGKWKVKFWLEKVVLVWASMVLWKTLKRGKIKVKQSVEALMQTIEYLDYSWLTKASMCENKFLSITCLK